jgi:hypothetical protein
LQVRQEFAFEHVEHRDPQATHLLFEGKNPLEQEQTPLLQLKHEESHGRQAPLDKK